MVTTTVSTSESCAEAGTHAEHYVGKKIVLSLLSRNTMLLGGQEIRWGRIAQDLSGLGFQVSILCTRSLVIAWEEAGLGAAAAKAVVFTESSSKLATWIRAQLFALRNVPKGSVVHLPGPGMLILPAAILSRFFKRCTILTSLTTSRVLPLRDAPFPRSSYWVFRVALAFSHLVDALNPKIDIDSFVSRERLSIAPCSFSDPEHFRGAASKRKKAVFAGHFNEQKGSKLLLHIARQWPKDPDYSLVLCGSGPFDGELRAAAAGRPNITIGRSLDMAGILADAKVFLSLQQWDNYPSQSLLEAMLSECCIVATNSGDTCLLVDQQWGRCLDLNAPASQYLRAILAFLDMSDVEHARAGKAARRFVMENHSRERYMEYLRNLWLRASTAPSRSQ
jgi:glycosyltransferase involved in cell wall biosynthesis